MDNDIQPIPVRRVDGVQPPPPKMPPQTLPTKTFGESFGGTSTPPPPMPEPIVEKPPVYTPVPEHVVPITQMKHKENQVDLPEKISEGNFIGQKKVKIIVGILVALIVVLIAGAALWYIQSKKADNTQATLDANKKELADTITAVGKLILLPTGETPQLATVTDPSKLKDQAFFANAQLNDKVLIYTGARIAILYRPSQNILVAVAPINLGTAGVTTPVPLTPKPSTTATPVKPKTL